MLKCNQPLCISQYNWGLLLSFVSHCAAGCHWGHEIFGCVWRGHWDEILGRVLRGPWDEKLGCVLRGPWDEILGCVLRGPWDEILGCVLRGPCSLG